MSKTLRQTINLLKQGQTPGQLGLGEDARQPGCENLLMLLYVQWCRAGTARAEERSESEEPAQVCFGLAAAHLHVGGGRDFRQPGELTSREKQDMDTYGYITRHRARGEQRRSALELWQILNHSASGFMCMQREPDGKGRVSHNQLLAVRRAGGRQFSPRHGAVAEDGGKRRTLLRRAPVPRHAAGDLGAAVQLHARPATAATSARCCCRKCRRPPRRPR